MAPRSPSAPVPRKPRAPRTPAAENGNGRHSAASAALDLDDEPLEQEDGDAAVDSFLSQYGGSAGYRVRVERATGKPGELEYCGTYDFTGDLLEAVRTDYPAGGKFRGRIVNADNQYVKGGTVRFPIAARAIAAAPIDKGTAAAPASKTREQLADLGMMSIFESMQNANKATTVMLERLAQPKPTVDIVALIAALGTIVVPLIVPLLKRDKTVTADDVARIVGEKMAARGESRSKMTDLVDQITAITELQEKLGGRGESDTVLESVKMLAPLLQRMFSGQGGQPALAAGDDAPVNTSPGGDPPVAHPDRPWIDALEPHVPALVSIAAGGKDPREFAYSVLTFFMPEQSKGLLRELVANEDAAEQVTAVFPALATYKNWTAEFIDEAANILIVDADDSEGDTPVPRAST